MSYERASVNCQRCYDLAQSHASARMSDEIVRLARLRDNSLAQARNDCMRALEEIRDLEMIDLIGTEFAKSCLLSACTTCDYSKPNIVNMVKGFHNHNEEE